MHIHKNIKLLRKVFRLMQLELGEKIGVSRASIAGYERNVPVPEYNKKLIAQVFHITVHQLETDDWTLEAAQAHYNNISDGDISGQAQPAIEPTGYGRFKNDMSRRFYEWYDRRFRAKELAKGRVAEELDINDRAYWSKMHAGDISVGLEQLILAKEKHGLNPVYILGDSEEDTLLQSAQPAMVMEDEVSYGLADKRIGKVIDEILTKHNTPREEYATIGLNMTLRNLQRIIKGDVNPSFALVQQIAEDHGEPLELFRQGPLPQGHYLALLTEKENVIVTQRMLIDRLITASAG